MRKTITLLFSIVLLIQVIVGGSVFASSATYEEKEPNNSQDRANPVKSGMQYSGYISDSIDKDWFKISPQSVGQIRVTLNGYNADYDVFLYDKNGKKIASSTNQNTTEGIDYVLKTKQDLYILVKGKNNSYNEDEPYTLKATYPSSKPKYDERLEPNDTLENAYEVKSGTGYESFVEEVTDYDWYKISPQSPGQVRITLSQWNGDYDVYLYDSNGKKLASSKNVNSPEAIDYVLKTKQNLYILVKSNGQSFSEDEPYTLKATYPAGTPKHNTNLEPNDTLENAYEVKSGTGYESFIEEVTDYDWYKISPQSPGQVRITLSQWNGDYDVYLYDSNGKELASSKNVNSPEAIDYVLKTKQNLYILVKSNGQSFSEDEPYTLKATYPAGTPKHNKNLEPNDTLENAYEVKSGTGYESFIEEVTDYDWFKFNAQNSGQIRVVLTTWNGDYDVYLYDSNGNQIATGTKSHPIDYAAKNKGIYYIKVKSKNGHFSDSEAYTIKASYPNNLNDFDYVNLEPNDTLENGIPIDSGVKYESTINSSTDYDWYKIQANKGNVDITLGLWSYDYDLYLYDNKGNELAYSIRKGTNSETISYNVLWKGDYYILVKSKKGDYGEYDSYTLNASFNKIATNPLKPEQILIQNNTGMTDFVTVTGLKQGDLVKVYDAKGKLIGTSKRVPRRGTETKIAIAELGAKGGTVYVTVSSYGLLESSKTQKKF